MKEGIPFEIQHRDLFSNSKFLSHLGRIFAPTLSHGVVPIVDQPLGPLVKNVSYKCNSADIYSDIFSHLCQFSFGTHETSVRQLLWGFRPLAVKVTAKSDISIDYGPSVTAQLVCNQLKLAQTSSCQLLHVI